MVLLPLVDVFENIVDPSHPQYHSVKYRQELKTLEGDLESILNGKHVPALSRKDLGLLKSQSDIDFATLEVYRLAALIYLERASNSFSGTSAKLSAWSSSAFKLLRTLGLLKHSFPIFIIGCEARTDEQRIVILDCIEMTQGAQPSPGMQIVQEMIQSAWALEDLETEKEVDYMAKLDIVISGCETMPSFA